MFDCPLHNQTSPTCTVLKLTELEPDTIVMKLPGELAPMLGRLACHFPSAPATAETLSPRNETVTVAPGVAVPKTGTVVPRCNTIFELKIGDTVNAPKAAFEMSVASKVPPRNTVRRALAESNIVISVCCGLLWFL